MRRLIRFLSSIELAVVLLILIAAWIGAASLVPQNLPAPAYQDMYGSPVADIAIFTGISSAFRSPIFLALAAALGFNLLLCTVKRLLSGKQDNLFDYAPDAIHTGILIMMLGAVLSGVGRQEDSLSLRIGDQFTLRDEYRIALNDTRRIVNDESTILDWESELYIEELAGGEESNGESDADGQYRTVSTNNPLRIAGVSIYQLGWGENDVLTLASEDGRSLILQDGEALVDDEQTYLFQDGEMQLFVDGTMEASQALKPGDTVLGLRVVSLTEEARSALLIMRDPGVSWIIAGSVVLLLGLALYLLKHAPGGDS